MLKTACRSQLVTLESAANAALLITVLVVGLTTAADYGTTIDEFNTNDYGPKALAWYTSGFSDHSQFETVEFSLWYYGPWFQVITAAVQSLGLAEPLTVRHCATDHTALILIDEVTRYSRAFAWTYVNQRSRYFDLAFGNRSWFTGRMSLAP